ncbi:MAG TPA: MBL fold metallo-hydrolase [Desulfurivibrionaceae bacterium]|nr:MBL fold metallo-hydrolase [Desulfurivibrionaceae bacterium]
MKIIPLRRSAAVYSCYSYLILGDWNRLDDVNTLIDPGADDSVLQELAQLSTGLGKVAVEQVVLTHNHFDHAAAVPALKERYNPRVFAFADGPYVDERLRDGQWLKAGEDYLEVLHTPGHSSDSICLYAPASRALFSGDTQLGDLAQSGSFCQEYLDSLKKLTERKIEVIFTGHNGPVTKKCGEMIAQTLRVVRTSGVAPCFGAH